MANGIAYSGVNQFLTIYSWFPLAAFVSVLMLIARFYQKQSAVKTRYGWFLLPIVLFGMASARSSNINLVFGDPMVAVLQFMGGAALIILCGTLYRNMTAGR